MSTSVHLQRVLGWATDLANVTAGSASFAETRTKVAGLASLLADAFPDARTFCRASLEYVAGKSSFFPSYAVATEHLTAWWERNRPTGPALPGADDASLDVADRIMLAIWGDYVGGAKSLPN